MSKLITIALVEGIENTLSNPSEAPRYDGWRLPLTLLSTGFSADSALDRVEYSGAIRYDQILINSVTVKEWNAFSLWLHFLCTEGCPTLDRNALVFMDIFKDSSGEASDFDTFSVSTEATTVGESLSYLADELKALSLYTTDGYLGDCDLASFHSYLTDEHSFDTPKGADKLIEKAMKVYRIISLLVLQTNTKSGSNTSLVVGAFKNLNTANVN